MSELRDGTKYSQGLFVNSYKEIRGKLGYFVTLLILVINLGLGKKGITMRDKEEKGSQQ